MEMTPNDNNDAPSTPSDHPTGDNKATGSASTSHASRPSTLTNCRFLEDTNKTTAQLVQAELCRMVASCPEAERSVHSPHNANIIMTVG